MKYRLISDVINIVIPPGELPDVRWNKIPDKENYGHFELLYDEELANNEQSNQEMKVKASSLNFSGKGINRKGSQATWK